jgi:hypothetical protein
MLIRTYSTHIACALVAGIVGVASLRLIAQEPPSSRPDLSGRWELNVELSENAQAKVDRMQSSQGHGPGRHGGLLGGLFGGGDMKEARNLVLDAPSSFTLTQDGDRIVRTDKDGRIRRLVANGQKDKLNRRDVRTKWDGQRLVSEISVGDAKVIDTYERSTTATQLIVTTRMTMQGHDVSVRRVYDARVVPLATALRH